MKEANFTLTSPPPIEDESRLFELHDQNGAEFKVKTIPVGTIDEVFERLPGAEKAPENLKQIIEAFQAYRANFKKENESVTKRPHLLISGRFVRDLLLGQKPNDIDLVSDLSAQESLELLKDLPEMKQVGQHGKASEVVRIKFQNGEEYEVSSFKGSNNGQESSTPGQDALSRDLSLNAVFYNPFSGNIVDFAGGIDDIKAQKIRFSGQAEDRIKEDALRMLRYVRFKQKTGFEGDNKDEDTIRQHANEIQTIDRERIKGELDKLITSAQPRALLEELDRLGLLEHILPAVKAMQDCEQGPPYHLEGDVYKHTLMVSDHLPENASPRLKWATILHDIAKPETREESEKEGQKKVSFIGHDQIGAERAGALLKDLRFSQTEIKQITWIIENHQNIFHKVTNAIHQAPEKNKAKAREKAKGRIKEMLAEAGKETLDDLIALAVADSRGKISDPKLENKRDDELILEIYREAMAEAEQEQEAGIDIKKTINGQLMTRVFNVKPGPEMGKLQKALIRLIRHENQQFNTQEELMAYLETVNDRFHNQENIHELLERTDPEELGTKK